MMERNQLYKILGVQSTATERDIKIAYHKLAKQYHPDKNKSSNAEDKFKEIVTSYDVLKDTDKRRLYDLQQKTAEILAQNAKRREEENKNKSPPRETFYEPSWSRKTQKTQSQKSKPDAGTAKQDKKPKNTNTTNANKTFNGKAEKGKKEKKPWQGSLDSDDYGFEDISGPGPKPSFAFKFFFDHSDPFKSFMEFFKPYRFDEFDDTFFGPNARDPFEDIYSWGNSTTGNRNRPVNTPSSASGYSHTANGFQFHDDPFPSMNCAFCRKNFELKDLKGHEEICKRLHTNPTGSFGYDSELRNGDTWPDSQTDRFFDRSPTPPYSPRETAHWRDRHEETINKIKQSKRNARYGINPAKDSNLVDCKLCGRQFNPTSYRRHQPFCPGVSQGGEFGVKGQRFRKNNNGSQQANHGKASPSSVHSENLFDDEFHDGEYSRTSTSRRSSRDINNDSPFPPPRQPRGFTQRSWSSMNDEDDISTRFPDVSSKGKSVPTSCHYCGAEYAKSTARFCGECGAKRTYGTNTRF